MDFMPSLIWCSNAFIEFVVIRLKLDIW
jgi:hypothetical protein